nr:gustatory receptor 6 [Monochamus saltuarius]
MDASFAYEEFFKSRKCDIKLLRLCVKCTRLMGMTPYVLKKTPFQRFYLTVLIFVAILSLTVYVYIGLKTIAFVFNLPDRILQLVIYTNEFFMINACLFGGNLLFNQNWNRLFASLYQSELLVNKCHTRFPFINGLKMLYFKLFIVFATCVPFHVAQVIFLFGDKNYERAISYIGWLITDSYGVTIVILLLVMNKILSGRYQFLSQCLRRVNEKYEEKVALAEIELVMKMYRISHCVATEISTIFGWHVFFYLTMNQTFLIHVIEHNIIMLTHLGESSFDVYTAQNIVYCISYVISLILLIMSFESVETSGQEVIKTCYLLHETSRSPLMKFHLLQLAMLGDEWRPSFKAGFYNVNQSTLSSIFNRNIKYTVVIMQLYFGMNT